MAEETNNIQTEIIEEESSSFNFGTIYKALVLNWKWFALSLIICLGAAYLHLRYTMPNYNAYAKMLVKEDDGRGRRNNSLQSMENIGLISQSLGIQNEMQILSSSILAADVVRDLKLYVNYFLEGRITGNILYKDQPITVDIDPAHLERLNSTINLSIKRTGNNYEVTGVYYVPTDEYNMRGPYGIKRTITQFPTMIRTNAGYITFNASGRQTLPEGRTLRVSITSPRMMAGKYAGALSVTQKSEESSVLTLSMVDQVPRRAMDYLNQLVVCYNRQANADKNEVAVRTEEFINERLAKINGELGSTDGALESYKRRNRLVELKTDARESSANASAYEQKLNDINTQIALIDDVSSAVNTSNRSSLLPTVGLQDASANQLINEYNKIALERNRLLRTAAENSPIVEPLTEQLDEINSSIKQSLAQARRNATIQRNAIASQHGQYTGEISRTPEQERILTQIGRQQEVKSGLYLMLLQKREENSISLAATADKGKMIELPKYGGQVSPNNKLIYLIALAIAILLPSLIIFLVNFFRYRIEGHEDVARLTELPILADVAIASDTAKTKADIVVHENKNNQMEEIFRSMRTNLQFMLSEGQKVVMFTSSTSGEGKTFNAANIAVSFALLGKKVILVGLDIRKPRLAELLEINDHHHGITPLLQQSNPTVEDVKEQILSSGINENLDTLMAGPIPPNPAEMIARPALDTVINILRDLYDYIIIDTAPVGLVTDTLQIARVCDATVYMCRADYTPKSSFQLINSLAIEKKLPNMAIVINGIDMSKKKYGYYYGYGKYGKYGRYGYGRYGAYGRYGSYGRYGYGRYGYGYGSHQYGTYGQYGNYTNSRYGDKNDDSVKR